MNTLWNVRIKRIIICMLSIIFLSLIINCSNYNEIVPFF